MANLVEKANRLIPKPLNIRNVDHVHGSTADIISSITKQHISGWKQTVKFAKFFYNPSVYDILNLLWKFTKKEINYKVDPRGEQFIKTPAVIWAHREGDCKSYSLFMASILQNLNIPYVYRFVSYSPIDNYTHVYIKAGPNLEYTLDCCMDGFNKEKKFTFNKDVDMTKITSISGIEGEDDEIGRKLRNPNLPHAGQKLHPKVIGKRIITLKSGVKKLVDRKLGINPNRELTHGELQLRIARDRTALERDIVASMRGIGSLKVEKYNNRLDVLDDAIEAIEAGYDTSLGDYNPDIALGQIAEDVENGVYSIAEEIYGIAGIGKKNASRKEKKEQRKAKRAQDKKEGKRPLQKLKSKAGKFIKKAAATAKKVGKNLLKVVTAPQRLAVKGILEATLPKNAMFFIYLFITDPNILNRLPQKVLKKRKKAEKIANFIVNTIGMKRPHFMGIIRNGILKKYKMQPEAYLSKFMKAKVSGLSGITGIHGEYIGIVKEAGEIASGLVQLLNKLMDLFKKKGDKSKGEDVDVDAKDVADIPSDMEVNTAAEAKNMQEMSEAIKKQPETGTAEGYEAPDTSNMTKEDWDRVNNEPKAGKYNNETKQYEPIEDGNETKEEKDILPANGGKTSGGWS